MTDAKLKSQLLEMDLYKLLECEETCTVEQIKKAYRKRALEVHPDKNPDKKEEAEKAFIQLGKAFEILADKSARAAYDAARKSKREKALRDSQMDAKRREMKEKLERSEKAAREKAEQQAEKVRQDSAEQAFFNEIERVRRENRRLLEEENNKILEQLRQEKLKRAPASNSKSTESAPITVRIKASWPTNESCRLSKEFLQDLFSNYGRIENLIVGTKASKPSALLEFKSRQEALVCLNDEKRLADEYSIQLKCLDKLESSEPIVIGPEAGADETTESFEDLEARILKKMRSAKN